MPHRYIRVTLISAWITWDCGFAIYRRLQADECDRVSYTAHIAGALTGVVLGIAILHNVKEHPWERILAYVSLALYSAIVVFFISMVIFTKPFSRPIWNTTQCREKAFLLDIGMFNRKIDEYQ
ncbi:unnamed protein product [Gongylonema pulchrum]|uniref:Rhomboid domain-containing protein n=1 Tax=Gongylonema pulchrum TaxID=637853 RepID=A0A183D9I2_9BILA|nr:unnamed protein product [Gongylonema pulchrum]